MTHRARRCHFAILAVAAAFSLPAQAELPSRFAPKTSGEAMVVTPDHQATDAALFTLQKGGNAIDAALTAAYALAVTQPQAAGIGGGGVALVSLANRGEFGAIDFRETAPSAYVPGIFYNKDNKLDKARLSSSPMAVGVPGAVAGLDQIRQFYGTMSAAQVMVPAVVLAEKGIDVSPALAKAIDAQKDRLVRSPASREVFLRPIKADPGADKTKNTPKTFQPLRAGEKLVQEDLARTLRVLATKGPEAFYTGDLARLLVANMEAASGLIRAKDLADYKARLRKPVETEYRNLRVVTTPPPAAGGAALVQMLNVLQGFDMDDMGPGSAAGFHVMAEAMRLAYGDAAAFMGDPDAVDIPLEELTSDLYGRRLQKAVSQKSATPSRLIQPGANLPESARHTAPVVVVDKDGNVAIITLSLSGSFGTGLMVPGTGVLLNSAMADFTYPATFDIGQVKRLGRDAAVTQAPNAAAPGRRPVHWMTPALVYGPDGHLQLAMAGAGGMFIPSAVMQTLVHVVDHDMNLAEAVHTPRAHHGWQPDQLTIEPAVSPDTAELLATRGHKLAPAAQLGEVMAVQKRKDGLAGMADPRAPDGLAAGP